MRIGIDIGGTFTDFVCFDPQTGNMSTFKLLSTPGNPADAMLAGLGMISTKKDRKIIHGSTVATNALLERKGDRTALITTKGFRDILHIGRQNRPQLYDFFADPPPPLVPDEWRLEVKERVNHKGEIQIPLETSEMDSLIPFLKDEGITSVAVCLLFSFLAPKHEQEIANILQEEGYFTSISSDILPVFREYERTSTTVVNAYVSPILDTYIEELETKLPNDDIRIMQSNGGSISPAEARQNAVRCILSGPAGGVVGANAVASIAGFNKIISFDMGGTSTDVSLVDVDIQVITEADVGGYPIRVPILDIHTVGSGGGSIAKVDAGGALRVGPESAGADPGPACYGKGKQPTVTDANLILGRIASDYFLGGKMRLDEKAARQVIEYLASEIHLSPEKTAMGIIQVANAHMERALRVISIDRGHDPRDFSLFSFGGAGGLHAVDLARGLSIPMVIVPPQAATLSALGMLMADVVKDYSLTVMLHGKSPYSEIDRMLAPLKENGQKEVESEGIPRKNIFIETSLDIRYQGQSYELNIPFSTDFLKKFHKTHNNLYGYANEGGEVEIVNLRVKVIGKVEKPILPQLTGSQIEDPSSALVYEKEVYFSNGQQKTPFYSGEKLLFGNVIPGPAIVLRPDTTVLIGQDDIAKVDRFANLIIKVSKKS
jgi:N-methylhydantoinase A